MEETCQHLRLELRGASAPHLLGNTLWLDTKHLVCLDCGAPLTSVPEDVTRILNIPHPQPEECQHEDKVYHLGGSGEWTCFNCGEKGDGPVYRLRVGVGDGTPSALLYNTTPLTVPPETEPTNKRVEINAPAPQADLHIIGTVLLIQREDGDYGVIQIESGRDTEFVVGLLQRELLRFEGQGIEITVRRLG